MKKWTYNKIQNLARERGLEEIGLLGKLITNKIEFEKLIQFNPPSLVKLEWSCGISNHDSWITNVGEIKRGTWCPECSKMKKSFSFELLSMNKFGVAYSSCRLLSTKQS